MTSKETKHEEKVVQDTKITPSEINLENIELVKKFEEEKQTNNIDINLNININPEEIKAEEHKKKKRKRNRKKKTKDGVEEDEEEDDEKNNKEEELKKLKENKYKAFWDVEFANKILLTTRAQDNSIFRVIKSWPEKDDWKQT